MSAAGAAAVVGAVAVEEVHRLVAYTKENDGWVLLDCHS